MKFNEKEIDYLSKLIDMPATVTDSLKRNSFRLSTLTDEEAYIIRELCADRLPVYGFYENYEINPEGKILEGIIDKLYDCCGI